MASSLETVPSRAQQLYSMENAFGNVHPQQYKYSFSGADARVLAFFPQRTDLINYLDSVQTISVSVHEAKQQVRSLGYRGSKGVTRSVRTIAGSMILTVINDHPLRPLIKQYNAMIQELNYDNFSTGHSSLFGWSADKDEVGVGNYQDIYDFQNRLAALLPPFNVLIEFVSETAPATLDVTSTGENKRILFPGAGMMLHGVEFVDEGLVVSVNDMVTEITLSYIARDFKPFSANTFHDGGNPLLQSDIKAREYELFLKCFPPTPMPPSGESLSLPGGLVLENE